MSVTFSIRGARADLTTGANYLNLANGNARDLLRWLDLPADEDLFGSVQGTELAARCRRRLWDEPRNHDPALEPTDSHAGLLAVVDADGAERVVGAGPGPRVIFCGRSPDYLRDRTQRLLELAVQAGDRFIDWG